MIKLLFYLYMLPPIPDLKPTPELVYQECLDQGLLFPEIVTRQAILETGHFKSYSCRVRHNLFGLTKPKGGYFEFSNWKESVTAYKTKVQYKYKGGDYYMFLDRIGYASAENYIKTLKRIKL